MFKYNKDTPISDGQSYTWEENNTGFVAFYLSVSGHYEASRVWELYLWTASYDSDDKAKCYYIRRKGAQSESYVAINGGIISDKLTYGKGIRCMKNM